MKTRMYFLDNLRTFLIFLVILYHAGFTYQSAMQSNWIVVDSTRSDSIGLVGLYIDVFVMAIMFYISGYFIPESLKRQNALDFVKRKFNRIMVPWIIAVFTLIPAYKMIFLYSRGLPQEEWYTYFHLFQRAGSDLSLFSNDPSQHWLWFLPVLFMFQVVYLAMSRARLLSFNISLKAAVILLFLIGIAYSMTIARLELQGWSLTALLDFQRERLLVYFMFFLLGTLSYKLKVFEVKDGNNKYIIISNIVLTVGLGLYTVLAINFLLNLVQPGRNYFFISQRVDGIVYFASLLSLMLAFLHILLHTFKSRFNKTNKMMKLFNKNSYNVYIIHMIVMGLVALTLINITLPVVIKYFLLTGLTFIISNFLIYVYNRFVQKNLALKLGSLVVFMAVFYSITYSGDNNNPLRDTNAELVTQVENYIQEIGLHEAVIQGNLEAIQQHIKAGSDLNIKEPSGGSTPLITAAVFGKTEIAKVLIDGGADVNLKNNEGSTALHSAAFFCHTEIVGYLLSHGADRSIKNNTGSTALDSVIGPFENVKGIYDYFGNVLGPLGLKLDMAQIEKTRPEIAEILRK